MNFLKNKTFVHGWKNNKFKELLFLDSKKLYFVVNNTL